MLVTPWFMMLHHPSCSREYWLPMALSKVVPVLLWRWPQMHTVPRKMWTVIYFMVVLNLSFGILQHVYIEQYPFQPCLLWNSWGCNHSIPKMWSLSMLIAPLVSTHKYQWGRWASPIGRTRWVIQFMHGIPDPHLLNLEKPKITIAIGGKRRLGLEGTIDVVKQQSPKPFKGMDGAIPEDCITCGVEPVEGWRDFPECH